jgi:hypothetical protein
MWKIVCKLGLKAADGGLFERFFDKLGNKNVLRKVGHE